MSACELFECVGGGCRTACGCEGRGDASSPGSELDGLVHCVSQPREIVCSSAGRLAELAKA